MRMCNKHTNVQLLGIVTYQMSQQIRPDIQESLFWMLLFHLQY